MLIARFACPALLLAVFALPAVAQPAKGRKIALLIGVADYRHASLPALKYTENDVEALALAFSQLGADFHKVRVLTASRGKTNKDNAPTAENIANAIKEVLDDRTLGRRDTVLIALSGHGVTLEVEDPQGEKPSRNYQYFCPSDAHFKDVSYSTGKAEKLLLLEGLFKDLAACGAGTKLVFIDACRNELKAESAARSMDLDKLSISPGLGALFSCAPGQRAWETSKLESRVGKGHGVFFYHVAEGLLGKARDEDGEVTWDGLTAYVRRNVQKKVPDLIGFGAKQTPQAKVNISGSPVLIRKLSEDEKNFVRGMDLLTGVGGKRDARKAQEILRKAADNDHPLAQATLAWSLQWAPQGLTRDEEEANRLGKRCFDKLKAFAEGGNSEAQYLVGRLLEGGLGVEKDLEQAIAWYRKAIAQDHSHAMVHVAHLYRTGNGLPRDAEESFRLYERSARLKNVSAMLLLGDAYLYSRGVPEDLEKAAEWYRKAADAGDEAAQLQLGWMHDQGKGVTQDYRAAFLWWKRAADLGHPIAMSNLGYLYNTGRGVASPDPDEAFQWYLKAAERGYSRAQFMVGEMYANGRGVGRSDAKAKEWYKKAADRGHEEAKKALEKLEKE